MIIIFLFCLVCSLGLLISSTTDNIIVLHKANIQEILCLYTIVYPFHLSKLHNCLSSTGLC